MKLEYLPMWFLFVFCIGVLFGRARSRPVPPPPPPPKKKPEKAAEPSGWVPINRKDWS